MLKPTKVLSLAVVLIPITACAVKKTPTPVSGSKADGVVKLAYQTGGFEKPQVQWDDARQKAKERCKAWGYESAEKFGGKLTECLAYNAYGCMRKQVSLSYQCVN